MAASRGLIWRYYAYRVTSSTGFYLPVSIVYLHDQGFGLAFIGLTQAVFSFAMLAAEIPSGYLGDRLGKRASLAVGNGLRAVALTTYAFAEAPVTFLAIQAVWAAGWAFRSGTQDAWLYELLEARFDESKYARIEGRGSSVLLATSAATAIVGSVLYTSAHSLPFLANATLAALGIPLVFSFPKIDSDADEAVFTVREATQMLRLQASRPSVRWLVVYAALFTALFSLSRTFEQPAMEAVGIPIPALGVLYAAFKLVSAGATSTTGWFEDRLGTRGVFALLVPVFGLAYASVAVLPVALVPVLFLYRATSNVIKPIRNQYLNDRLEDVGRATVLSGVSMVLALSAGVARVVGGPIAAATGPVQFLAWTGVAVTCAASLVWVFTSPVRPAEESPEGGESVADGQVAVTESASE